MKFLWLSMICSFSAMHVIRDSAAGLRDSPIHSMQFDLDFDRLESVDRIQAELDGVNDESNEEYDKALASEFTTAIKALNEVQVTNENLMRVLELMEIINKTKAARWQYYIDISVSSFIGGVLTGLVFGAAMILFQLKIRSCNGIMTFCLFLTITAFFNYYVVTYLHKTHFSTLYEPHIV